ncbi:hypothetical protein Pint_27744 [Pistacia integerrima]|uniref:Uncharacterized protein n=1 Tax=Pistacia integerrima TaxID=434235 RepID=A0ACC0YND4_9ROSI|nr:hypothetical protein Pint_27744 [Pistacia integerrima]
MILTQSAKYCDGTTTQGSFFDIMVANEHFIDHIPDNLPLDVNASLLCASINVHNPLRFYELDKPGMHLGVIGLGRPGHVLWLSNLYRL